MPSFRLCSHLRLFCQLVAIQVNANSKAKCMQCNGEKNTTTVPPNDIIHFLQVGCLCHCCPLPTPHGYTQNTEQQVLRLLVLKPHMHILYAFIALVYIVWHQYRGPAQPGMSLKKQVQRPWKQIYLQWRGTVHIAIPALALSHIGRAFSISKLPYLVTSVHNAMQATQYTQ